MEALLPERSNCGGSVDQRAGQGPPTYAAQGFGFGSRAQQKENLHRSDGCGNDEWKYELGAIEETCDDSEDQTDTDEDDDAVEHSLGLQLARSAVEAGVHQKDAGEEMETEQDEERPGAIVGDGVGCEIARQQSRGGESERAG